MAGAQRRRGSEGSERNFGEEVAGLPIFCLAGLVIAEDYLPPVLPDISRHRTGTCWRPCA